MIIYTNMYSMAIDAYYFELSSISATYHCITIKCHR